MNLFITFIVAVGAFILTEATDLGYQDIDGVEIFTTTHTIFEHVAGDTSTIVPFVSPVSPIPDSTSVLSNTKPVAPFMSPVPTIPDSFSRSSSQVFVPFMSPVSTIPDTVTTTITSQTTSTLPTTRSSRPPESGFWTGPDPFPHFTPTSWLIANSRLSSTSGGGEDISTSKTSKTTSASSISNITTTPVLSTSVSTSVIYVIASPTTSVGDATSAQAAQAPTSTFSTGWSNTLEIDSWIVVSIVMIAQGFL